LRWIEGIGERGKGKGEREGSLLLGIGWLFEEFPKLYHFECFAKNLFTSSVVRIEDSSRGLRMTI